MSESERVEWCDGESDGGVTGYALVDGVGGSNPRQGEHASERKITLEGKR